MATKNSITGDEIKSKPLSTQGQRNWERIFAKKNAHDWQMFEYGKIVIVDPNGWRHNDGVTVDTPISFKDFLARLKQCTTHLIRPNEKL